MNATPQVPHADARMPRQIPFIIGNEACERFSFYGMRNILVPFLISSTLLATLPEGPLLDPGTRTLVSEATLAYAALALPLVFTGPGRMSLDHGVTASSRERKVERRVAKRLSR